MLVYSKENKHWLVSLLVIILDGLITYFMPIYFNKLNFLYPMLTISLIPFLYKKNSKNYYKYLFILGIIYDLFYSNIFLFHALLFLVLGKITVKIFKIFKSNLFVYIFLIIINILIYDGIVFTLVYLTNYQSISLSDYCYKIEHSLLLNIIFGIIAYILKKD